MELEETTAQAEPKSLVGGHPLHEMRPGSFQAIPGRQQDELDVQAHRRNRSRQPSDESDRTITSLGKPAGRQQQQQQQQRLNEEKATEETAPPSVTVKQDGRELESPQTQHRDSSGQGVPNFSRHTSVGHRSSGPSRQQSVQHRADTKKPPKIWMSPNVAGTGWQGQAYSGRNEAQPPSSGDSSQPPYSARYPEEYMPSKTILPPKATRGLGELYTVSHLIFFSILGTLARLGIQWLTFYPGAPVVTPVVWANLAGSAVMGFLAEDKQLFRDEWAPMPRSRSEKRASARSNSSPVIESVTTAERARTKKTIPLYVGLATGFCGSFTSFSSFMRDVFLALSNNLPTPVSHRYASTNPVTSTSTISRNGGYSFMALIAVILATLALSLGGLIVGAHAASLLDPLAPRISSRFTRRFLDPLMVLLGFGCWLGALFLTIWPPDRPSGPLSHGSWANETWRGTVLFTILFAPVGCLLRFYVSLKLNGLVSAFPLGTFAVNMFGTAIEGMLYDIQHVGVGVRGRVGGGMVACQALQGMQDGFCGCLTTVSTWVAEIKGLKRSHSYLYMLASVVGGTCLMIVIMGSVRWTVGWSEPVCIVGYTDKA